MLVDAIDANLYVIQSRHDRDHHFVPALMLTMVCGVVIGWALAASSTEVAGWVRSHWAGWGPVIFLLLWGLLAVMGVYVMDRRVKADITSSGQYQNIDPNYIKQRSPFSDLIAFRSMLAPSLYGIVVGAILHSRWSDITNVEASLYWLAAVVAMAGFFIPLFGAVAYYSWISKIKLFGDPRAQTVCQSCNVVTPITYTHAVKTYKLVMSVIKYGLSVGVGIAAALVIMNLDTILSVLSAWGL